MNYIHKRKQTIIEGELRCRQLAEYLDKLNAPRTVVISEDASGIVARVSFDSGAGQLIGIELSTDFKTGCPTPFTIIPQNVNEIDTQVKNNRMSTLVYLVLAQPIMSNAPPFILQVFGTIDSIRTTYVSQRWQRSPWSSDICPYDRQNFASFERVSNERVLTAMEKFIPDSEAIIIYLKLTRMVTEAFTNAELSPLTRICSIWEALYFFRIWKLWIQTFDTEEVEYHIEGNFISQNAFHCLELNAYRLLHLISKFRESKEDHLFQPTLFNSQRCEQTSRQFRRELDKNKLYDGRITAYDRKNQSSKRHRIFQTIKSSSTPKITESR